MDHRRHRSIVGITGMTIAATVTWPIARIVETIGATTGGATGAIGIGTIGARTDGNPTASVTRHATAARGAYPLYAERAAEAVKAADGSLSRPFTDGVP
jgi:hypothetical protein